MLVVSNHILFFTCLVMASSKICPLILPKSEVWLSILQLPGPSWPFSSTTMAFGFFQSSGTLRDCHDLAIFGVDAGGSTCRSHLSPLRTGAFYYCCPKQRPVLQQLYFLTKTFGCPSFFSNSFTLPVLDHPIAVETKQTLSKCDLQGDM